MKKLCELFDIRNSQSIELINCDQVEDGIRFVARTSKNNGITARIAQLEELDPMPSNALTVALSGSVLSVFYQDEPFYTAFHIACLYPKQPLTEEQMLYYACVIEQNKYRYNYGRQANKTLKNILVPDINELSGYVNNISINKYQPNKTPVLNKKLSLNKNNWDWLNLNSIFDMERGVRLTKPDREKGNIPLITAGLENEGVAEYISNDEMRRYQNSITVDMFGNCFYRGYIFCCDDNILVLSNKNLNTYTGLFLSTIIHFDEFKFAYGRQYRQKNFYKHKIKLPVTKDGSPDWQFMEDYIKTLPYSKAI